MVCCDSWERLLLPLRLSIFVVLSIVSVLSPSSPPCFCWESSAFVGVYVVLSTHFCRSLRFPLIPLNGDEGQLY